MHWFVTGKTKFYTLKIYFWASFWTKLKKKKHDLWYCIYSIFALTVKFLADTFIPMWLLRKSSFAYIVSCISFTKVLFSVRLKSTLCAGSWRLGTHREVWEDIEEKKKKVSWGKQPMENKHLSANAWCEINVLRFSPRVDHVKLMWWASLYKHRTEQTERLYTPCKAQNDTVFIAARDKSLLFC